MDRYQNLFLKEFYNVPISDFVEIDSNKSMNEVEKLLSYPMIGKLSIYYASLHMSNKSVVNNRQEPLIQIEAMFKIINEDVFIEKYLSGYEYTAFISGNEKNG
jgi:D-alanine-D-alanine ligase-like ATP-grasp enzyme